MAEKKKIQLSKIIQEGKEPRTCHPARARQLVDEGKAINVTTDPHVIRIILPFEKEKTT